MNVTIDFASAGWSGLLSRDCWKAKEMIIDLSKVSVPDQAACVLIIKMVVLCIGVHVVHDIVILSSVSTMVIMSDICEWYEGHNTDMVTISDT